MSKTILTNCTLLDGSRHMEPQRNKTLVLSGDKICDILDECPEIDPETAFFDLQGHYVLPGLINLSCDLAGDGRLSAKPAPYHGFAIKNPIGRSMLRLSMSEHARLEMNSGVTTLLTVNGVGGYDSLVRDWINVAHVEGPGILSTNLALSARAEKTDAPSTGSLRAACYRNRVKEIAGPAPLSEYLANYTGGASDYVRILADGPNGAMPDSMLKELLDLAAGEELKSLVHVESAESARKALDYGARILEGFFEADENLLTEIKKLGAGLILSFSVSYPWLSLKGVHLSAQEGTIYKQMLQQTAALAKRAAELDIPFGLGSYSGQSNSPHDGFWRELAYLQASAQLSGDFCLHAATGGGAAVLGLSDRIGSIQKNLQADFFVTDRNPLEDLSALSEPTLLCVRGLVTLPRQFKNKRTEQRLNEILEVTQHV